MEKSYGVWEEKENQLPDDLVAEVIDLIQRDQLKFFRGHSKIIEMLESGLVGNLWVELDSVGMEPHFCVWLQRSLGKSVSSEAFELMSEEEKKFHCSDVCAFFSIPESGVLSEALMEFVENKKQVLECLERGY